MKRGHKLYEIYDEKDINYDDIPEIKDFSKGRKNPHAQKIRENGYSIIIHYSPEDVEKNELDDTKDIAQALIELMSINDVKRLLLHIMRGKNMDTISINLNRELTVKARPVLNRYGIDIETALNVYLMQIISGAKLLSQRSEKTEYVRPAFHFGCLKGLLNIDDDFSDVLADFKEYM